MIQWKEIEIEPQYWSNPPTAKPLHEALALEQRKHGHTRRLILKLDLFLVVLKASYMTCTCLQLSHSATLMNNHISYSINRWAYYKEMGPLVCWWKDFIRRVSDSKDPGLNPDWILISFLYALSYYRQFRSHKVATMHSQWTFSNSELCSTQQSCPVLPTSVQDIFGQS